MIIVLCFFCLVCLQSVFRWISSVIKILLELELFFCMIVYDYQKMTAAFKIMPKKFGLYGLSSTLHRKFLSSLTSSYGYIPPPQHHPRDQRVHMSATDVSECLNQGTDSESHHNPGMCWVDSKSVRVCHIVKCQG